MQILIGLDFGSQRRPAGICVVEQEQRNLPALTGEQINEEIEKLFCDRKLTPAQRSERLDALLLATSQETNKIEDHFTVRHLEALPAGGVYAQSAERVAQILTRIAERTDHSPTVYVDITGKGNLLIDLLREKIHDVRFRAVTFTHGDRRVAKQNPIILGKAFLVTRLQLLLQLSRLHLPRTRQAETLAKELRDYEVRVEPDANERYGGFPVGHHDELVTALGLAVQIDPIRWTIF